MENTVRCIYMCVKKVCLKKIYIWQDKNNAHYFTLLRA